MRAKPMPDYLTTKELADLLRIKERKVYDLAAAGEVPCARVTGKLLFPHAEVRAWLARGRSGPEAAPAPPNVVLGSHDPLLEWALRESRCGLATYFDGSLDGLARFRAREGVAAGLHLHEPGGGTWNVAAVAEACAGQNAALVGWAVRRRGLVVGEGEQTIRGIEDLRGRRAVPRQAEAGAQVLFERLLAEAGLDTGEVAWTEPARSEADAALVVARGQAEAALGLEALAAPFRLGFVPLIEERFDLLIDRRAWFEPPWQTFWRFCRGDAFRRHAADLAGYALDGLGEVRWNGA